MRFLKTGVCLSLIFAVARGAHAGMDMKMRPDDRPPAGVMGAHAHQQGKWMLGYSYGRMDMDGNRDGDDDVSVAEVHRNYMVAPLEMYMEMHVLGAMYGASDKLTVTAMAPYVRKSMKHVRRDGLRFTTRTSGLGDVKLTGLYTLLDSGMAGDSRGRRQALLQFGVSLPTGSIDKRDETPLGRSQLPYPMQLGSGTFDPILGVAYVNKFSDWSWGAQAKGVFRVEDNDEGYRLGNEYDAAAWIARRIGDRFSTSLRLAGRTWGDIHGEDDRVRKTVAPQGTPIPLVPTADTRLRGGDRVDAAVGLNFYQTAGFFKGHRLGFEFTIPVHQDLDGPQLETDYRFNARWTKML